MVMLRMVLNCELAGIKMEAAKGCMVSGSDNIQYQHYGVLECDAR
jgi:hypothetical protein